MNMNVRIAAAAYAVPDDGDTVEAVLEREKDRVEATLAPLSPKARQKAAEGLGLSRVRVCGGNQCTPIAANWAAINGSVIGNVLLTFSDRTKVRKLLISLRKYGAA